MFIFLTAQLRSYSNSPFDHVCVAYKYRAPSILTTLSHKADAVPFLEIISLGTISEFLPGTGDGLEASCYLLIVTFLIRVQVAIKEAALHGYVNSGEPPVET